MGYNKKKCRNIDRNSIYSIFHDVCLETEGISLPANGFDETTASSASVPLVGPIREHNAQLSFVFSGR